MSRRAVLQYAHITHPAFNPILIAGTLIQHGFAVDKHFGPGRVQDILFFFTGSDFDFF